MEPTMPEQPKKVQSIIFIVALFVILLIIAFALSSFSKGPVKEPTPNTTTQAQTQKTTEVTVEKVDLTKAQGDARLPKGFPADIPVDATGAFESYTADYPTQHATQYTVSYATQKTVKDAYDLYLSYMTKNGYTFRPDGKDAKNGFLYGTKDNNDLSILVSSKGTFTSVQMTYLVRK